MQINKILVLSLVLLYAGCTTVSEAGYYWGNYSKTYYTVIKEPSAENLAAHEESLRKIMRISEERGLRVGPGIYAELAYLVSQRNADDEALALYQKEMMLYPESKIFLERLVNANNKEEG